MGGGRPFTRRRMALLALGAVSILLLACVVPSLVRRANPPATFEATALPLASPTSMPTVTRTPSAGIVSKISEAALNQQVQGMRPQVGEGVDVRDIRVRIRKSGIIVSASVQIAELANAVVPVEVQVQPVVREQQLRLEVLDVQLGGPYAAMSTFVKPMLKTGVAEAFDASVLQMQQGVRISNVELQDGYLEITTLPNP